MSPTNNNTAYKIIKLSNNDNNNHDRKNWRQIGNLPCNLPLMYSMKLSMHAYVIGTSLTPADQTDGESLCHYWLLCIPVLKILHNLIHRAVRGFHVDPHYCSRTNKRPTVIMETASVAPVTRNNKPDIQIVISPDLLPSRYFVTKDKSLLAFLYTFARYRRRLDITIASDRVTSSPSPFTLFMLRTFIYLSTYLPTYLPLLLPPSYAPSISTLARFLNAVCFHFSEAAFLRSAGGKNPASPNSSFSLVSSSRLLAAATVDHAFHVLVRQHPASSQSSPA